MASTIVETLTSSTRYASPPSYDLSQQEIERLKIWVNYSFAAYRVTGKQDPENHRVLPKCQYTKNGLIRFTFVHDDDPSVGGFMAVDHSQRAIVLSFKGTVVQSKFESVIKFHKTRWPPGEESKVYLGALQGYQQVNTKIFALHEQLHRQYPAYTSYIVGHSMGGVHAIFYATEFQGRIPTMKFEVVTFAMPKPGDGNFAALWNRKNIPLTQVNNFADLIPHLPPDLLKYQYLAPPIVVDPENNRTVPCNIAVASYDTLCTHKPSPGYHASAHSSFWGEDGSVFGPKV
ncbi:hypothetical protein IWQ62_004694 [Dispira parvispora]|uniref:Fungal lipase-type domain-containing protein n=1 Tax=Dispira parvispora TaxID=1520584 RepID=A0A9W8ARD6_9FUNG|nr:hypothetical protein IWQ62_004694 [Dispira parvispora]